jgi:hypothetical protein
MRPEINMRNSWVDFRKEYGIYRKGAGCTAQGTREGKKEENKVQGAKTTHQKSTTDD